MTQSAMSGELVLLIYARLESVPWPSTRKRFEEASQVLMTGETAYYIPAPTAAPESTDKPQFQSVSFSQLRTVLIILQSILTIPLPPAWCGQH